MTDSENSITVCIATYQVNYTLKKTEIKQTRFFRLSGGSITSQTLVATGTDRRQWGSKQQPFFYQQQKKLCNGENC